MADDENPRIYTTPDTGKFAPGNPGRPRGSRNVIAAETLRRIKDLRDPALASLEARVRSGDMQAVALVLQYILPKGRTVQLSDASPEAIIAALADGDLSFDEAAVIASTIEKLKKLKDMEELEQRIERVEKLLRG